MTWFIQRTVVQMISIYSASKILVCPKPSASHRDTVRPWNHRARPHISLLDLPFKNYSSRGVLCIVIYLILQEIAEYKVHLNHYTITPSAIHSAGAIPRNSRRPQPRTKQPAVSPTSSFQFHFNIRSSSSWQWTPTKDKTTVSLSPS